VFCLGSVTAADVEPQQDDADEAARTLLGMKETRRQRSVAWLAAASAERGHTAWTGELATVERLRGSTCEALVGVGVGVGEDDTEESQAERPSLGRGSPSASSPFDAMTVRELRAECKRRGWSGYSRLHKAELVTLLQQRLGGAAEPGWPIR
jgi:hypothetical protein